MIYTSYFGKMRKFPENVFPVAICIFPPSWYRGAQYMWLAPTFEILTGWKIDRESDAYTQRFNSEILGSLDADRVVTELQLLLPDEIKRKMQSPVYRNPDYHIALMCFEKPDDFCHRHLVADWLRQNGYECEELS